MAEETQSQEVTVKLTRLGGTTDDVSLDLSMLASDFVQMISERFEIDPPTVKIVCKGKMLKLTMTDKTLGQLRIRNGDKMVVMNKPSRRPRVPSPAPTHPPSAMAVDVDVTMAAVEPEIDPLTRELNRQQKIQEIREAAEKLAARSNDGFNADAQYYMELRNQNGDPIQLPERDRQALTMGLTLHEKGKALLKRREYDDALPICKLAFDSFQQCDPQWLDLIDNYGLLALDIVWMYYLKHDEQKLTEAHQWLQIAERGLQKSHGPNLERLRQVRQGFMPEIALYVRLKILRAMLSFYSENLMEARNHLHLAEMDLRKLQISDADLAQLQMMGFTEKESRRGLRATNSNMEQAITHVLTKRTENQEREFEERERLRKRRRARALGRTKSGEFVNLTMLERLRDLGVAKEIGVEALKQTDNHDSQTLDLVLSQEKRTVLETAVYRRALQPSFKVDQLVAMGFPNFRIRAILELNDYNLETATQILAGANLDILGEEQDLTDIARLEQRLVEEQAKIFSAALAAAAAAAAAIASASATSSEIQSIALPSAIPFPVAGDAVFGDPDAVFDINSLNVAQNEDDVSAVDESGDVEMADTGDDAATEDVDVEDAGENEDEKMDELLRQRTEEQIQEHLLDDMDDVDDPDAYLDLDLREEIEAIEHLKTLFASVMH